MIIDCHCQTGQGDGLTGLWDAAAPLDQYLKRATKTGIERTVLFADFHSDCAVVNREAARVVYVGIKVHCNHVRITREICEVAAGLLLASTA